MDPTLATLWILRILFLVLIYLFLFAVARVLLRDLRSASRERSIELGRLIVLASPSGEPAVGAIFPLDAVTTLGRDVNNAIVVDDQFASAEHCELTFRGRAWFIEDLGSTNGTLCNGAPVEGTMAVGFGDEIQIGESRFRLERGRTR